MDSLAIPVGQADITARHTDTRVRNTCTETSMKLKYNREMMRNSEAQRKAGTATRRVLKRWTDVIARRTRVLKILRQTDTAEMRTDISVKHTDSREILRERIPDPVENDNVKNMYTKTGIH